MNTKSINCPYCGSEAEGQTLENFTYVFVTCPTCGRYEYRAFPNTVGANIRDKVASYLYYNGVAVEHENYRFFNFIGSQNKFQETYEQYPWCHYVSRDEIEAFYPKSFSERIDKILIGLAQRTEYIGKMVELSKSQIRAAFFVSRYDKKGKELDEKDINQQFVKIADYLTANKYIDCSKSDDSYKVVLEADGWNRVDQVQKSTSSNSKNVFVAMSFAEDMKETRETIKKAITDCGFIPRLMDEIEHNHQIVPEMLYEIKQARFVIAELTGHNNGAYFEAGYALGLGKEVIQVCNKEKFGEDGHFDVKQINTVMWENQDDLLSRLSARIKATVA